METAKTYVNNYPGLEGMSNAEIVGLVPEIVDYIMANKSKRITKADITSFIDNIGYKRVMSDDIFWFLCCLDIFEVESRSHKVTVSLGDCINYIDVEDENRLLDV